MGAYKLNLGDANQYLKWDGANLIIKGSVTITGGSGIGNLTDAGNLAVLDSVDYSAITGTKPPSNADYFGGVAGQMAFLNNVELAKLGTTIISGGYLRTDLIKVKKVYVGGGTNEDIIFEDSGVRMFDAGNRTINIYKSGYASLQLALGTTAGVLSTNGILQLSGAGIQLFASSGIFNFNSSGVISLPNKTSNPTGQSGGICMVNNQLKYWNGSVWVNA